MEKKNPLRITETILRDAHQSQAATRMRIEDMLPACELLDNMGYWSLECFAILGILAGIAIPRFMDSVETARGAKLLADLRSIESAGTVYYTKNGKFPTVSTEGNLGKDKEFIEQYFESWPVSTGGYAIVQGYNGVNYRYNLSNGDKPYEYAYNSQTVADKAYEGRATIDQKTLEQYLGG